MAMDRAEKLGLGAAIGGHALLLGAMVAGLLISDEPITGPEAISVSLVGEIAEVSTAPDAIQEESAPPAPAEAEPAEPPPAPTPAMQIERPVEKPQPKPVAKPVVREAPPTHAKTAPKKVAVKQPPAKAAAPPAKSARGTTPTRPGGFSKSFEETVNAVGKAPGAGKAVGTPAAKSAAEVRRSVSVSLAGQIRSRVRACAPSGIDINKIETFVTLSLDASGRLNSVRFDKQVGVNESNQPQAGPLKDCILQAVRAASPYEGLDPEYHDVWKNHALRLRATG
jgi:periplasmic protein TonB